MTKTKQNPAEFNKSVLTKRAAQLTKVIEKGEIKGDYITILPFQLSLETFALETKYVKEVYPLKDVTRLPGAPLFLYGITSIRRKIFPIIDLKVFFSFKDKPNAKKSLLIIGNNESEFALLTDGFSAIRTVLNNEIQLSLPTLTGMKQEFLKGIISDGTVILDGQKLLTSPHLMIKEEP